MMIIENLRQDPYFNIALDAYLTRHAPEGHDYLMLWQNRPAVIIGRFQNAPEEVHAEYAREHDIAVVRRMSGGGAVYQDLGNLNYSLVVTSDEHHVFNDYQSFTKPVVNALAHFGVEAELTGRNDVTVQGQKFSGNAQYRVRNRLLHHGTIMYDVDLDVVQRVLNVRRDKIESKGFKSVRSRVTNLKPYLGEATLDSFHQTLTESIARENGGIEGFYRLTEEDVLAVEKLVSERFGQFAWNFGQSPAFNLRASQRFPSGLVDVRCLVEHAMIREVTIYGDFFSQHDIGDIGRRLTGAVFEEREVSRRLDGTPLEEYLGISQSEFVRLLFDMTPV